jgi:copper chaperone NosL
MLNILIMIAAFTTLSCSTDPEPINWGTDQCEHCKMTIVDNKFGAEIVTKKGKAYKFDAVECMMNYVSKGKISDADVSKYIVVDASKPGSLINAEKSVYLISENFPSPMGANLSAFGSSKDADSYKTQYQGEIKSWEELCTKFKVK